MTVTTEINVTDDLVAKAQAMNAAISNSPLLCSSEFRVAYPENKEPCIHHVFLSGGNHAAVMTWYCLVTEFSEHVGVRRDQLWMVPNARLVCRENTPEHIRLMAKGVNNALFGEV